MKILAIHEKTGLSREYSSAKELKRYLKEHPSISTFHLKCWCLYRISPDGSKLPMHYDIHNMYDFADRYRI